MIRVSVGAIGFAYLWTPWWGVFARVCQIGPTSTRGLRTLADLRRRNAEAHLAAMQARRARRRNRHLLAMVHGKAGAA